MKGKQFALIGSCAHPLSLMGHRVGGGTRSFAVEGGGGMGLSGNHFLQMLPPTSRTQKCAGQAI